MSKIADLLPPVPHELFEWAVLPTPLEGGLELRLRYKQGHSAWTTQKISVMYGTGELMPPGAVEAQIVRAGQNIVKRYVAHQQETARKREMERARRALIQSFVGVSS